MNRFLITLLALSSVTALGACSNTHAPKEKVSGMPNPAATYCIEQKGTLEPRTDSKGNATSYCHLKSGEAVEEWAFFRQNHKERKVGLANPAATYCIAQKGTLEPRTDSKGNAISYCHLKNGEVVEEWAFYRKNHQK